MSCLLGRQGWNSALSAPWWAKGRGLTAPPLIQEEHQREPEDLEGERLRRAGMNEQSIWTGGEEERETGAMELAYRLQKGQLAAFP